MRESRWPPFFQTEFLRTTILGNSFFCAYGLYSLLLLSAKTFLFFSKILADSNNSVKVRKKCEVKSGIVRELSLQKRTAEPCTVKVAFHDS